MFNLYSYRYSRGSTGNQFSLLALVCWPGSHINNKSEASCCFNTRSSGEGAGEGQSSPAAALQAHCKCQISSCILCGTALGSQQVPCLTSQKSSQGFGSVTRVLYQKQADPNQFLAACNLFSSSLASRSEHCPRHTSKPVGLPV